MSNIDARGKVDEDQGMSDNNKILFWIVAAVFTWGTVLAVGAYVNFHFLTPRFFVVIACVNGFLAFWLVLLWSRRGRTSRISRRDNRSSEVGN